MTDKDPHKVVEVSSLETIMTLHDAAAKALALYTIAMQVRSASAPDLEKKASEARARVAEAVVWALPSVVYGLPTAYMYESDGMIHDDKHPPILTFTRWSSVEEPWSETPLHRPMKTSDL